MGDAGRKFPVELLERHCSCRICVDLRADREAREQQALYQLSQGDDLGEQKNYS